MLVVVQAAAKKKMSKNFGRGRVKASACRRRGERVGTSQASKAERVSFYYKFFVLLSLSFLLVASWLRGFVFFYSSTLLKWISSSVVVAVEWAWVVDIEG